MALSSTASTPCKSLQASWDQGIQQLIKLTQIAHNNLSMQNLPNSEGSSVFKAGFVQLTCPALFGPIET